MAGMVAFCFPFCCFSVPDAQKRWIAVLPSAAQPSRRGQLGSLHAKPRQAQKGTAATASPPPAAAGRGATPDRHIQVYSCPPSLLFHFFQHTVLSHFWTRIPMGFSSFYAYLTLAYFFLKWVIQTFCHSASLPIATVSSLCLQQENQAT